MYAQHHVASAISALIRKNFTTGSAWQHNKDIKSKSGALIGDVEDVKRTVVQSRDTIFFFKLTVLHVRSLIRHDLNLGNTLLCRTERGNTEKLPRVIKQPLILLKVIIEI